MTGRVATRLERNRTERLAGHKGKKVRAKRRSPRLRLSVSLPVKEDDGPPTIHISVDGGVFALKGAWLTLPRTKVK